MVVIGRLRDVLKSMSSRPLEDPGASGAGMAAWVVLATRPHIRNRQGGSACGESALLPPGAFLPPVLPAACSAWVGGRRLRPACASVEAAAPLFSLLRWFSNHKLLCPLRFAAR